MSSYASELLNHSVASTSTVSVMSLDDAPSVVDLDSFYVDLNACSSSRIGFENIFEGTSDEYSFSTPVPLSTSEDKENNREEEKEDEECIGIGQSSQKEYREEEERERGKERNGKENNGKEQGNVVDVSNST